MSVSRWSGGVDIVLDIVVVERAGVDCFFGPAGVESVALVFVACSFVDGVEVSCSVLGVVPLPVSVMVGLL